MVVVLVVVLVVVVVVAWACACHVEAPGERGEAIVVDRALDERGRHLRKRTLCTLSLSLEGERCWVRCSGFKDYL